MTDANSMTAKIIALVAETHIHPGIGQSTGALDLPVARERTTQYPFIPGSGVKGAYRVWADEKASGLDCDTLFGKTRGDDAGNDSGAGGLLCSDARLLLLPTRCLSDAYKWLTCPAILRRLERDCNRAGYAALNLTLPLPSGREYYGFGVTNTWLGLEERELQCKGAVDSSVIKALKAIVGVDMADAVENRLVIVSDTDFTWFAQYALPVMARNDLDENKVSKNLWYEEALAPDTIMHVLLGQRRPGQVKAFTDAIAAAPYVQMGGNETIGQGWFKMVPFLGVTA